MRVSDQKLDPKIQTEIFSLLYQVVVDLGSPKETKEFLEDILSPAELTTFAKRLAAAYWLKNGRNYEDIKTNLKLSSATIATIDREIKNSKGFKVALTKIAAEKWASGWEKKIKNLFRS